MTLGGTVTDCSIPAPQDEGVGGRSFRMKRAIALLLLALILAGLSSPWPVEAAAPPLYTLDATLEYEAGLINVRQTVEVTNRSSQSLESLVFSVTPAYFDAFQLLLATAGGQVVKATLDDSLLELPLPRAVPPGGLVRASLDFIIKVPNRGGRFGRGPQAIALGNWFPILAVYRDGRLLAEGQERGWVRGKYVDVGDAFFSETADFLVTLRTDQPLQIAHTGDLVSQDGDTWSFEALNVRDFAMAVSPSFASISQTMDGVEVRVFYLPGHQATAVSYLRAALQTAAWLNRTVAGYPYRRLDVAEVNAESSGLVGQEYPGLFFMADAVAPTAGGIDSYGSVLASHEAAHQWFYANIGNDQLHEPWLDEATVTWLSNHFVRLNGLPSFQTIWQNRILSPPLPNLPVNASIYTYPTEGPYLAVVYRRGAVFLEELYQAMGDEAFFTALKRYGSNMAGRTGTPFAFLDTMQAHTEANLNPIIARYFTYSRYSAPEPLRAIARYPDGAWSGTVRISLDPSAALRQVEVYVDDSLHIRALPSQIAVDTASLETGPHLLTIRASDGAREVDLVSTFEVRRSEPAPPTPTAKATATATPTPPAKIETPEPMQPASSRLEDRVLAAAVESPASRDEVRLAGAVLGALALAALVWGLAVGRRQG